MKELGYGGGAQARDIGGSFDAAGFVLEQQGSFFDTGPAQTLRHTSHVTRHTSHITLHKSHVT